MKIHQLPLGARFEYEGKEFLKTGPMFATGKDGQQRLIPKYAVLKVQGDAGQARDRKGGPLARADVLQAFEAFCAASRQLVAEDRWPELDAARERFLAALGVPPQN